MSFSDFDPEAPEIKWRGIEMYAGNDNFFRKPFTEEEFNNLVRISLDSIPDEMSYRLFVSNLPTVVMIDLGDILKYLRVTDSPGLTALDVETIATVVCAFLGEDSEIGDTLWNSSEDEIMSDILAKLGLSTGDDAEYQITSVPFDNAVAVLFEIANVIQRYLVNARFPLIEMQSVYRPLKYNKGILALRLNTWREIVDQYPSADDEDEDDLPGDY